MNGGTRDPRCCCERVESSGAGGGGCLWAREPPEPAAWPPVAKPAWKTHVGAGRLVSRVLEQVVVVNFCVASASGAASSEDHKEAAADAETKKINNVDIFHEGKQPYQRQHQSSK